MPDETDVLRKLGSDELSWPMQCKLEVYLQDGKVSAAKAYILGGVDSAFEQGKITSEHATEIYTTLGVPPAEAAELRDGHVRRKQSK